MGWGNPFGKKDEEEKTADYGSYWHKWKKENSLYHAYQPGGALRKAFLKSDKPASNYAGGLEGHAEDMYRLADTMSDLKAVQERVSELYAAGVIDKKLANGLMNPNIITTNDGLSTILERYYKDNDDNMTSKKASELVTDWRKKNGITDRIFATGSDQYKKRRSLLNNVLEDNFLEGNPEVKLIYDVSKDMTSSNTVNMAKLDFMASTSKKGADELEKKFLKTLGDDWFDKENIKLWIESGQGNSLLGDGTTSFHRQLSGDSYDKAMNQSSKIPYGHNYKPATEIGGSPSLHKYSKDGSGFSFADVFSGGGVMDMFVDIGKFAVETAFDAATASFDWIVDMGEGIDDLMDGENFWDVMGETGKKIVGLDVAEDAYNMFQQGDNVGALLKLQEFSSTYGNQLTPDTQQALNKAFAKNLEEFTSDNPELAKIRDDLNVMLGGGEIPEPDIPTGDINVSPIKKTTMDELKQLLGILPGDGTDVDVIPALLGEEARKMADDPDIARMRELQGGVAETGFDVGEREALSAKARRELAGMARQQGMAAGAAAGGLRGASVGAQARALAEKAMQKQADVTTEMDKASIARKDEARRQLAGLAKDVTKFDIEKEEERKKRKGATTIGVQSLLSQEELGKQQLQLAGYPVEKE